MITNKINGTILNSFYICKRKTWFLAHEILPDYNNPLLEIGRIIEKNSYARNEKGFNLLNIKIDLVRKGGERIIIGEVKKSSKNIKPAMIQVSYYLMSLKEQGVIAKGEILIPKEHKKIPVFLTDEIEKELKIAIKQIEKIIEKDYPPNKERIRFCTHCAYREFCWS